MKRIFQFLILMCLAGGVIFAFLHFYTKNRFVLTRTPIASSTSEIDDNESTDVVPPEIQKVDATTNTFIHKQYGFSLEYPSDLNVTNFAEGGGEQILFQDEGKNVWFQIFVTPWDETGDLTVARIKKDLPDLVIDSPQSVILGPKQKDGIGPHAIIFFSKDPGLGDTREVWFTYEGNMYQVTTAKSLDTKLGQILSTLTFNN